VTAVVADAYRREASRAGGAWHAHVSMAGPAGTFETVVDDDADRVTQGYSVQKLAVAVAVLDKVDRNLLRLDRRLRVDADLVIGGSGSLHLQPVWGDELTLANILTAMLLVSDNTAVRLCGRVAPAEEINEILAAKGFAHTRLAPAADPHRFLLGVTTPRETHDLLRRLAAGSLLAPASGDFLLRVTRAAGGYQDGVRRDMSSAERARVACKAGADFDERGAARHEVGVIFDRRGAPALTYAFFADALGDARNYGGTHPAVRAHAALGRIMLDAVDNRPRDGRPAPG
jgi:beta-lactamase class A